MDLNETLAFVAVARTGSFTAAARQLGAPKPTVSRRVARLEDRLRVRLLERTTRRQRLTDAGRAYFERCVHGVEAIENAERAVRDVSGRVAGTLRISLPADLARDVLIDHLPELHRRHPELSLVLDISQRRVDLVADGFDVALRAGGRLDDNSLIARKIIDSELWLVASPAYLKKRGTPRTPSELDGHDLVVFGAGATPPRWTLDGPDGACELPRATWLTGNDFGFVRTAVLAGLGIGLVEAVAASKDVRARRLRRVLPAHAVRGGSLWAVYPSSRHLSPAVRVFIDFIAERIGR